MRKPRVFVSSTCYDLGQVRDDLRGFIQDAVGYEAVLSEHRSFPVNPDSTTIENSQNAVRNHADIFVLLVGGRYGTIDKRTNRSITNDEYAEAVAIGLPIYAFVLKTVDTLLPVWQENPELKHPQVESPRVFEFVQQLKDSLTWVYVFENAKDIIEALRVQWAYLLSDGLEKRGLLADTPVAERVGLRGEALEIAIRKEDLWEYKLFLCLLTEELQRRSAIRRDLELEVTMKTVRHFEDPAEFMGWSADQFAAAQRLVASWNRIIPEVNKAFGPPGQPGDLQLIVYVTSRLGSIYHSALEWALLFHQVSVKEELTHLCEVIAHFMDDMLESFGRLKEEFSSSLEAAASGQITGSHEVVWTITLPDDVLEEYDAELTRVKRKYGVAD